PAPPASTGHSHGSPSMSVVASTSSPANDSVGAVAVAVPPAAARSSLAIVTTSVLPGPSAHGVSIPNSDVSPSTVIATPDGGSSTAENVKNTSGWAGSSAR